VNTIVGNPTWTPPPLNTDKEHFGRALLVGAVLEALLVGGLIWVGSNTPPPKPVVKKIIAIHMVQPVPPKPKPVPPPPKPMVHPKPLPRPVPLPKPVVHHVPVPKPLIAKTPLPLAPVAPPRPPVVLPPPPPPPPAPSMAARQVALAEYAAMVRAQVQADAHVPEAIRLMHLSGTAVITFRLAPSGRLQWAKVSRSSGAGPIDRAALKSVEEGEYPPFSKDMPKHATNFTVEVHLSGRAS